MIMNSQPLPDVDIDAEPTLPCQDKLIFATQKQAEAAAAVNSYRYEGAKLKAYQCRYCGHWHLSSSSD